MVFNIPKQLLTLLKIFLEKDKLFRIIVLSIFFCYNSLEIDFFLLHTTHPSLFQYNGQRNYVAFKNVHRKILNGSLPSSWVKWRGPGKWEKEYAINEGYGEKSKISHNLLCSFQRKKACCRGRAMKFQKVYYLLFTSQTSAFPPLNISEYYMRAKARTFSGISLLTIYDRAKKALHLRPLCHSSTHCIIRSTELLEPYHFTVDL